MVVRKIPTYSLLLDALYPPPGCPVSRHFNKPQWHPLAICHHTSIYCSFCSFHSLFNGNTIWIERCTTWTWERTWLYAWTASSRMHRMLLVILSLSSGPVWFQGNGKLTSYLYVDIAWPMTFTFMQWYYKLLSVMVEPVCCFKSKYCGLLCWKSAYTDSCGRFHGKKYGVWYLAFWPKSWYLLLGLSNCPWCSYGAASWPLPPCKHSRPRPCS